jgi:molybdate transport system substrate-binding protein
MRLRGMRLDGTGLKRLAAAVLAAVLALGIAGCGQGSHGGSDGENVTVFAAASLKPVFTRLAADFEAAHPGSKVLLNFAGSSDLATQISQGAPADVFASADSATMAKLADAGLLAGTPTDFATNTLVIAVPPANQAGVERLEDLARPGVKAVVCAGQVPCGAAARAAAAAAGISLQPVSEEASVTDVLGKVVSGEADAGLVYVTDARNAGEKVKAIPFAGSAAAVNTYPIAAVDNGSNGGEGGELASQFIAMVTGGEGKKALAEAGFGAP